MLGFFLAFIIFSNGLWSQNKNEEFKPCTGPSCDPSHLNKHKKSLFIPHKRQYVSVKHLRKQQIARNKEFYKAQQKNRKLHQKIQQARLKKPYKRHQSLDRVNTASALYKKKRRNLDNVTFRYNKKVRKQGLDRVVIPSYRIKHQNLDNRRFFAQGKQKHRSLDRQRYANFRVRHAQRDRHRPQYYVVGHKRLDNRRMYIRKQKERPPAFRVDKPSRVRPKYAQKVPRDIVFLPLPSHRMLSRNPKNFKTINHKSYDAVTMGKYRVSHKHLDGVRVSPFKMKHQGLDAVTMPSYKVRRNNVQNFCYPKLVIPHKQLDRVCYPKLVIPHKQLDQVCYPKLVIPHKQLDFACGERPFRVKHKQLDFACGERPFRVKHKQLDFACGERPFRVKHKQLDFACGERPFRVKHKQLDFACGERPFRVKHKQLDNVCYQSLKICHRPLDKYKVPCDPNIVYPKSNLERVGEDLKYFFTNKRRFCKLNSLYSGVSAGKIIETEKYGKGVVVDYIVKDRLIQYVRYVKGDSTKMRVRYRRSPNIKQLVVLVPKDEKNLRKKDGTPNLQKVKLSPKETKEIMMKHLLEKRNFVWLIRMYPEEEKNLPELYAKYGGYREIKHPAFQKK